MDKRTRSRSRSYSSGRRASSLVDLSDGTLQDYTMEIEAQNLRLRKVIKEVSFRLKLVTALLGLLLSPYLLSAVGFAASGGLGSMVAGGGGRAAEKVREACEQGVEFCEQKVEGVKEGWRGVNVPGVHKGRVSNTALGKKGTPFENLTLENFSFMLADPFQILHLGPDFPSHPFSHNGSLNSTGKPEEIERLRRRVLEMARPWNDTWACGTHEGPYNPEKHKGPWNPEMCRAATQIYERAEKCVRGVQAKDSEKIKEYCKGAPEEVV